MNNVVYDVAIVLGTRFEEGWRLRQDLLDRLDVVVRLYSAGEIKKIVVSGKWTVWYDWLGITPPTTEARLMKDYLIERGVKSRDILQETRSKDTIGNLYYCRKLLDKNKRKNKKVAIVCADQRLERIRFITENFFGDDYDVSYVSVAAPHDVASSLGSEKDIFIDQKSHILDLKDSIQNSTMSIYRLPYYTDQAKAVKKGTKKNELVD